jgi:hypothetical protein
VMDVMIIAKKNRHKKQARGYGLLYSGPCEGDLYTKLNDTICVSGSSDWINPFYFSVATWTTLGDGDFTPSHELRLLASIEALAGYVFFGMVVGIATAVITRREVNAASPPQGPSPRE